MADGSISSSAEGVTPAWVRVAMPSVADLIFVALLCALVFTTLSVRLLGDAGIGWHIRTGQQILATHAVPRVDSFSSTMAGRAWFAWEWLYDVAVGLLGASLGLNGVVWFTAVVIAGAFAGIFRFLIERGTNVLPAVVLILLAVCGSMIHFLARPHVVSWLFTLAWFWILDSHERGRRDGGGEKKLWFLPLLMLVWVNVHGGFVLGFVLLAIFCLAAIWEWYRARADRIEEVLEKIRAGKRARNLAWAGLFSVVASLANPYGWKLHEHVYQYLSNRFLMDHIDEFQSPNFHGVAQRCFLVLLLITLAALAVRGRDLRVSQGLIVLFAVYAGLYASRNIPVSAFLLVMVIGPLAPAVPTGYWQRMTAVETSLRGHLWPVLAVIITLAIAANGGRVGSATLIDAHFNPQRMPMSAVDFLEKDEVKGPILSVDSWGGYLIYRLYPKAKVVVDDRHDLYGDEFFESYLKMVRVEPGWQDFLREHANSYVLLPKESALAGALAEAPDWKTIYADNVAVVFVRGSDNP
jgi:hypothetical protein